MSLFQKILSIFIDTQEEKSLFSPQDLTGHYKKEIEYCSLDGVFVGAHYQDIDHIIEGYKYRSEREKVHLLSDILHKLFHSRNKYIPGVSIAIVPVPMHWSRYLIRGFNHVVLLGEQLSKKENIPIKQLLNAKYSKRQSKLHKNDRVQNREHAFVLASIQGEIPETVILIDDVISTGSTINACAQILKKSGVKYVYGFFLASNQ